MFSPRMYCDCYRGGKVKDEFLNMVEIRLFEVPEAKTFLSYIQYCGDGAKLRGHVGAHELKKAHILSDYSPLKWESASLPSVLEFFFAEITPKPTHFVINAGYWPHTSTIQDLESIFSAAKKATQNSKGHVLWKETSPDFGSFPEGACTMESDRAARKLCARGVCGYFPFPHLPPNLLHGPSRAPAYFDKNRFHFSDPRVYQLWNKALLEELELVVVNSKDGDDGLRPLLSTQGRVTGSLKIEKLIHAHSNISESIPESGLISRKRTASLAQKRRIREQRQIRNQTRNVKSPAV